MDPKAAERDSIEVRRIPEFRWALNRTIADLDQNIVNARSLSKSAETVKKEVGRRAEPVADA
jgi:hypothetical protein